MQSLLDVLTSRLDVIPATHVIRKALQDMQSPAKETLTPASYVPIPQTKQLLPEGGLSMTSALERFATYSQTTVRQLNAGPFTLAANNDPSTIIFTCGVYIDNASANGNISTFGELPCESRPPFTGVLLGPGPESAPRSAFWAILGTCLGVPQRVFFECFLAFLGPKNAKKHSKSTLWGTPRQVPKIAQKALRGALSGPDPKSTPVNGGRDRKNCPSTQGLENAIVLPGDPVHTYRHEKSSPQPALRPQFVIHDAMSGREERSLAQAVMG